MEQTILRDNLADIAAYGLLGVGVLLIGFVGLELVTLGSLRRRIWAEGHRGAVVLSASFLAGLSIALTAGIASSTSFEELWRGVLYTFVYGIVTIGLMMFSFVLIDALTPGPLGSILLDDDAAPGDGIAPAVWISSIVFVAIGLFVAAAMYL